MIPAVSDFLLPPGIDQAAILSTIRTNLHCEAEPVSESLCRYLDNFDWSLYRAGAALEERTAGARREIIWRDLAKGGAAVASQAVDAEPGFIDAMPQGPVRDLLAPLLGIRRLLPVAEIRRREQILRVLNDDDKTVTRIVLEENRVIETGQAALAQLSLRLRLQPVRGYVRDFEDTEQRLQRCLDLAPAQTPVFLEALASLGHRPGTYSSKLSYRLDPGQRADAATKEILIGLFDTLEANVDGAIRNLDSEFLHDLRVATRRTRSVLSEIKAVFPQPIVDDFKARFAWLQQVTGPVRDLDVYLLDFPNLRGCLPPPMRDHLDPLRDWLDSHYHEEQSKLADALKSDRFRNLQRDWRAFLGAPVPASPPADSENAGRLVKSVADERIRGMFKRVCREGRAINDASPAEELHDLRKICKKLRYLMEFFQSL
ncbi:MAG: CHAD domain-containing protein, partial [Thiohalocapsa sp.]